MEKIVVAVQAAGLRLPVLRDLRRARRRRGTTGPSASSSSRNVKDAWWREVTQLRDDIVGLDAAILMHPKTWEASGHVENFTDPLVDCKKCKQRFRADQMRRGPAGGQASAPSAAANSPRPASSTSCSRRTSARSKTTARAHLPPPRDRPGHLRQLQEHRADLAHEDALRHRADRQGLPQRDHAAELHLPHLRVRADGDAVLRASRRGARWFESWRERALRLVLPSSASGWTTSAGASTGRSELAHYAKDAYDIEYLFPMGW